MLGSGRGARQGLVRGSPRQDQLDPEEAAYFLAKLEAAIKKRKIQIAGYLAAMLMWVLGMFVALAYYGTHDGFVGWVFLIPFAFVGGILWAFGRWSEAVARSVQPPAVVLAKAQAKSGKKPAKKAGSEAS
jgi:hypothetical protein